MCGHNHGNGVALARAWVGNLARLEIARARAPLGEHVVCDVGLLAAAHRGRRLVEGLLQRRVRRAGDGRHASGRSLRGGLYKGGGAHTCE